MAAARQTAQLSEVAVRAKKHEGRCKLCKNPNRPEIDDWLLRRSFRHQMPDGTPVNFEFVVARFIELGVENPTRENVTSHWKNHCEVVSRTEQDAIDEAVKSLFEQLSEEDILKLSSAQLLDLLQKQIVLEVQAKVKTTGRSGASIDHLIRIEELKTRQKQAEGQKKFLELLGGGIQGALQSAFQPKELPPAHPDLDAEVVHETEGVEAA